LALFLERNSAISLRKLEGTRIDRVDAFNEGSINPYLQDLETNGKIHPL
jgi:hypothetical protein